MGKNNTLYQLFNNMFIMYKDNNGNIFTEVYGLMTYLSDNFELPFPEGSKENDCLDRMYISFMKWRNGGVDAKYNQRLMIQAAQELCALHPANPYKLDKEEEKRDKKEQEELNKKMLEEQKTIEEEKKIQEQKMQEEVKVKLEEPEHMLGVIPEEEKEKKNWTKFLFPWKKEGESNDSK